MKLLRFVLLTCLLSGGAGNLCARTSEPDAPRIEQVFVLPGDPGASGSPATGGIALEQWRDLKVPLGQEQWLRLELSRLPDDHDGHEDWWLVVPAGNLRDAEAELRIDGRVIARARAGYTVPREQKSTPSTALALPLQDWTQGRAQVLLRCVPCYSTIDQPRIMDQAELWSWASTSLVIFSVYLGAVALLLIIQTLLYLHFRENAARDYAIFAAGLLIGSLIRTGYWDHALGGALHGFLLGDWREYVKVLNAWLGLRCICSFYDLTTNAPALARTIKRICWGYLVIAGSIPWLPPTVANFATSTAQMAAIISALASCALAFRLRLPGAAVSTVAWGGLSVGVVLGNLDAVRMLNLGTLNAEVVPTIGIIWEMLFNAIGLGYKLKALSDLKHEKEMHRAEAAGLGRMVRVLSHDISTPLSVITFASFQAKNAVHDKQLEQAGRVIDQIERAGREISEIVTLAKQVELLRLSSGQLHVEPLALDSLLRDLLEATAGPAAAKNIVLEVHTVGRPMQVMANRLILKHSVLGNALSNAVKFSPNGSRVDVALEISSDGAWAEIRIVDQGGGLPAAVLADLQKAEHVASLPGTAQEIGTGFGLPLMRDFVRGMGGSIAFETHCEGGKKGTRVAIRLRLATSPTA